VAHPDSDKDKENDNGEKIIQEGMGTGKGRSHRCVVHLMVLVSFTFSNTHGRMIVSALVGVFKTPFQGGSWDDIPQHDPLQELLDQRNRSIEQQVWFPMITVVWIGLTHE
jgi:hypothetical protein